ncbi:MAG: hypothetical protein K6G92_08210 [Bacteroidaceae bacterium]|nr:hypothetical protein [Bacteroidaceae bacterium]
MKKSIYYILSLISVLFFTAACENSAVDDLTGKYKAPENVAITSMADAGVEKVESQRVFTVSLTGDANISFAFVGNRYFLQATEFTPGSRSQLTNNTYIVDESYADVAGSRIALSQGNVNVEKDGDNYRIYGIVWLQDGNILKFDATGTLHYEDDAPVISEYTYSVTTEDSGNDVLTHQIVLTDKQDATIAMFSVRTAADATSLAGTYRVVDVATALTPSPGQAVPGVDLSMFGISVGGTYYVEDGKLFLVSEGILVITESNGMLTFEMSSVTSATSAGEAGSQISLLFQNVPQSPDYKFTQVDTLEDAAPGVYTHLLTFTDKRSNTVAGLALRNNEADSVTGEYTVSDALSAAVPAAGQAVPGTDLSMFGLGILGTWFNDEGSVYLISAGNVTVTQSGDIITVNLTDIVSADETGNAGTKSTLTFQAKKQI